MSSGGAAGAGGAEDAGTAWTADLKTYAEEGNLDARAIAEKAGLSDADADSLATIYRDSQLSSLRIAFFALILISLLSLFFSKGIPRTNDAHLRRTPTTG